MAFNRLISTPETYQDHRFDFFIDGLDEFEGDYHQQTKMIEHLFEWAEVGKGDIKLCISSKECNVFLDAFSACPTLRLQYLTLDDMRVFVSGRLAANKQYQARSSELSFLEEIIVKKAEGVFLWVHLVLNAVEEEICDGADNDTLCTTLDLLPSNLEQLFEKLFATISPANLPSAPHTFVLRGPPGDERRSTSPPSLLSVSGSVPQGQRLCDSMTPGPLTSQQVKDALSLARRKVTGQCEGFLQIRDDRYYTGPEREHVTTTHPSLVEFLRRKFCSLFEIDDGIEMGTERNCHQVHLD